MSGSQAATYHQSFQPFPNLDTPMVNVDLTVSIPWYSLFVTLWNRTGGGNTPTYATGVNTTTPGGTGLEISPAATPYIFTASVIGVLIVSRKYSIVPATGARTLERGGETTEFSRDGGKTWQLAGIGANSLFLFAQDQARISWFTADPPVIKWYGVGAGG